MIRVTVVLAVLLLSSIICLGQTDNRDSVLNVLEKQNLSQTDQLKAYHWLSFHAKSPEEELEYGKLLLSLAMEYESLEYTIKAKKRIGVAHRLLGNVGISLEFLFEGANDAAEDDNLKGLLAEMYAEISTTYTLNSDSDNALLYGSKTIEILRALGSGQRLALTLLNTGYDYYLINNFDSALAYYNESEPILTEIGMTQGLAYIIGNRALVFWKQGKLNKAKKDLFRAIEMLQPLGDRFAMADYYNQLGNIYLDEGNEEKAIQYTMRSLEMAKEEGLKEQVRDASYLLFQLNRNIGKHELASEYLIQHYAYRDSIQNLETTQEIANLRTEFEVGQKQAEVDLLLQQRQSNQIIIITGGITLFIVVCLVFIVYAYYKTKVKLNAQLEEQKDSLISLNNTKDKFFSIISHDLRGPVGVLSGLVSVTKYFIEDKKTEQLREMMDKMEQAVDRLVKLLDNLLHWALQQRGHFPYVPEHYSTQTLLEDTCELFRDMATSKDINLQLNIDQDFSIFVDKHTSAAIFRNLLNNAIKFTPKGGLVLVTAKVLADKNMGCIQFKDNGVGIPSKKMDHLFELNESKSTKGTSGESGLGLGLQLVHDFVHINKGEITVESGVGKGTTITVDLPLG